MGSRLSQREGFRATSHTPFGLINPRICRQRVIGVHRLDDRGSDGTVDRPNEFQIPDEANHLATVLFGASPEILVKTDLGRCYFGSRR